MAQDRTPDENYEMISERHGETVHRKYNTDPSTGTYRREFQYRSPRRNSGGQRDIRNSPSKCPVVQDTSTSQVMERVVSPKSVSSSFVGGQGTSSAHTTVDIQQKLAHQGVNQNESPKISRRKQWRDTAKAALDQYKYQQTLGEGSPSRKSRSPQFEAQAVSNVTVGPPIEIPTPKSASYHPKRGWELNETQVSIRGGPEVDAYARHQRQVNFDVPQGKGKKEKTLSLLKRFDRDATEELQKRRKHANERDMHVLHSTGAYDVTRASTIGQMRSSPSMAAKGSKSAREIETMLLDTPQSALIEAVERLAMAEAAVVYDGAVRAAEEAAARAPPELAEEAAAAGARNYRAEITHSVQEVLGGEKPIEIIGYVGITRPIKD